MASRAFATNSSEIQLQLAGDTFLKIDDPFGFFRIDFQASDLQKDSLENVKWFVNMRMSYRALGMADGERSAQKLSINNSVFFSFDLVKVSVFVANERILQEFSIALKTAIWQLKRNSTFWFKLSDFFVTSEPNKSYYFDEKSVLVNALNGDVTLEFDDSALLFQFIDTSNRASDVVVLVLGARLPSFNWSNRTLFTFTHSHIDILNIERNVNL